MPRHPATIALAVSTLAVVMASVALRGQAARNSAAGSPANSPADAPRNLALYATPSTSFVSGHETLEAINDGFEPRNQADHSHGAYGNWNRSGTQWVQYDWPTAISTSKIDVYWWADGQGVHLPVAARVLYWNGNDFVPVSNPQGLGVAGGRYNTTTFDEITTTRIRLAFDSEGTNSTGIIEWKVFDSGKSPRFPPAVIAGQERSVVMPAKTFLTGRTKGGAATSTTWVKKSGPGEVTFNNPAALSTQAGFTAPGDYVLALSAHEGDLSSSDTLKVHVLKDEFAQRLEPVYTKNYQINSPLWSNRAKALIVHWIPHVMDECSDLNLREGGINNIIQAGNKLADKPWTPHVGYPFSNAWVYNTVEAMSVALQVDPQGDPEIIAAQQKMRDKLEEWIPIILASQEPDGYMQSRFTLGTARENGRAPGHWTPQGRGEHEGYVGGYILEAAIANYLVTNGKDHRLYDAAKRLADCWERNIGPAPKKAWYDGHEEMEQALVRFGRFVNDVESKPKTDAGAGRPGDKYIALAKFLLDCRKNGTEYDQTHVPVIQQYEAVGHAVRASYLYSGMADIVMETRDPDYASAVASLWDDMVNRKIYITGGIGSGESSEGFGPDYSLRNNAYCESCSNCGQLFFQYKMNMAYHDAKYADLYEETLYNAILGDVDYSGNYFCYTNALDQQGPPSAARENQGAIRYSWHTCPCCVGNFPRTLLMLPTWTYAKSSDGIYVNLFLGSTMTVENVAGTNVQMVQATDYPWSGNVAITVNPEVSKEFSLRLRVPDRSVSTLYDSTPAADGITSLAVNGQPLKPVIENGYAIIRRTWKAGDKIALALPMVPQRVKALDAVAADRGRVAIKYGPLVYNIESADQNVNLILAPDSPLTAQWKPDLLGGLIAITGQYSNGSPLTAIPNYARGNRGGRTLVWMRDQ